MDVQPAEADEELVEDVLLLRRRKRHRDMLVIAGVILCLSFLLQVRSDQKVEFSFLPGMASPETCLSRGLWGIPCPGCGLTRSFIHLAAGDPAASLAVNRVGWLLALAVVIQLPYRCLMLYWLSSRGLPEPIPAWLISGFGWILILALIINWALRMVGV